MVALNVQVGDVIRGYDFKPMVGRGDSFIEGRVIDAHNQDMGYQAYKVEVTRDVFGGDEQTDKHSRVGHVFFIPWRVSFMEYQGRVINLSR